MTNIYNAIQNLYNMDKTTWQEVLSEMYNLVSDVNQRFDIFENKFGLMLGQEVTKELKKMYDDGSLGALINDVLLKDINTKVDNNYTSLDNKIDNTKEELSSQLDTIEKQKPYINIIDVGAIADDDSVDNIPFINLAISKCNEFGIDTVYIPRKTFTIKPKLNKITVPSNIKFIGGGKDSILKVANNEQLFPNLFLLNNSHNVSFENFCIDDNLRNADLTNIPSHVDNILIDIYDSDNLTVKNMFLTSGGTWAIRGQQNNNYGVIENNVINFDSGSRRWQDVSTIYNEGTNFIIRDNILNCLDTSFEAETGIECHGNNNLVDNNTVNSYKNGIIIIPNQLSASQKGGFNNSLIKNILNVRVGISIWTGNVTDSYMKGLIIKDNHINVKNKDNYGQGIEVVQYGDSITVNSMLLLDTTIINNTIIFDYRKDNLTKGQEAGINIQCITPIRNCLIDGNIIDNCGGQGMLFHESNYLNYQIQHLIARNNLIINCYEPIMIGQGMWYCDICNNDIRETSTNTRPMIQDVVCYDVSPNNLNNKEVKIYDNKYYSASGTKIHQLKYDMGNIDTTFKFSYPKYILEHNQPKEDYGYINRLATDYVGVNVRKGYSFIANGSDNTLVRRTAGTTEISTIGLLRTNDGAYVTITEWINDKHIVVNDATNIYPHQLLKLDSTKFNNAFCYVRYVQGNHIYAYQNSIVDFSKKADVVGTTLDYQSFVS